MKRYIRTKYGRAFDLERYQNKTSPVGKAMGLITLIDKEKICDYELYEKDIIKQADTIEELCDDFVFELDNGRKHLVMGKISFEIYKDKTELASILGTITITNKYGAVWTDIGLVYVAKMNEKGDLELL